MTSYVRKGICAKCGKVHMIPEIQGWEFKCNECGCREIFENQELIIKTKVNLTGRDKVDLLCNKCEGLITHVGHEESYGYTVEIYKCEDCNKEYTSIRY